MQLSPLDGDVAVEGGGDGGGLRCPRSGQILSSLKLLQCQPVEDIEQSN